MLRVFSIDTYRIPNENRCVNELDTTQLSYYIARLIGRRHVVNITDREFEVVLWAYTRFGTDSFSSSDLTDCTRMERQQVVTAEKKGLIKRVNKLKPVTYKLTHSAIKDIMYILGVSK